MSDIKINGYDLSRKWFNFCFENPELIKPNHTALYFFTIEHCNRLGWKNKFGLPTTMAKEAIGIRSYNTYINTLNDLIEWGFIILIEKSKNQYSSNIITISDTSALSNNDKALDKALINHTTKQRESTRQSIGSIDKQRTKNKEQINIDSIFNFKKSFIELGVENVILDDWIKARKNKRATNSETSFKKIKSEIDKSGLSANECIKKSAENGWAGFNSEWVVDKQKQNRYGSDFD